jgi:hypothetical protein
MQKDQDLACFLTHDVIGKPLHYFERNFDQLGYLDTVPSVFYAVQEYFMEDQSRLANSHLFAKLG